MRRKSLITALLCAACLSVTAGVAVMAEEMETEAGTEAVAAEEAPASRPSFTALDYVTLGEYKGIEVTVEPIEVTDEAVDARISENIANADAYDTITEGTVQNGDIANIDYEGKKDDVAFDGGTAAGYDLGIGTHSFIDGFEDGLIGVKVGETVDLDLTFPEVYHDADLAGQPVVFTVTVNSIKRPQELSDELAGKLTDGAQTTVDGYRESVKADLTAEMEQERQNEIAAAVYQVVYDNSEIKDYPQDVVEFSVNGMKEYYEEYAQYYSMEFEEFVETYFGYTMDEFDSAIEDAAKQNLQQEIILLAVAEAENMEVSAEELAEKSEEYAPLSGYATGEELLAAFGEDTVKSSILENKAIDYLVENAIVIDPSAEQETE